MSVSLYIDFLKSKGLVVCKTESKVNELDIGTQHQYKPVTFTGVLQHQHQLVPEGQVQEDTSQFLHNI